MGKERLQTLLERLKDFENHCISYDNLQGAEILSNARNQIKELEAELEKYNHLTCPNCNQSFAKADGIFKIKELEDVNKNVWDIVQDCPELNMSNYDIDQVAALNNAIIEIYLILKALEQK